ncbi:MAG: AraC family transcriptional regulator, partial [Paenibacillus sp.]|nr:AraC family transcriptional regulator [Paenibacillus sp.]
MSDNRGHVSAFPALQPLHLSALDWNVIDYNYWGNKREFLLQMDIYPTWCLFAVENGSFSFVIGETTGTAGSGSLVLCPPNTAFRRNMISPELTFHYMRLICSEFHPGGGMFAKQLKDNRLPPILITPGDRQRLFDTFEKWRKIESLS